MWSSINRTPSDSFSLNNNNARVVKATLLAQFRPKICETLLLQCELAHFSLTTVVKLPVTRFKQQSTSSAYKASQHLVAKSASYKLSAGWDGSSGGRKKGITSSICLSDVNIEMCCTLTTTLLFLGSTVYMQHSHDSHFTHPCCFTRYQKCNCSKKTHHYTPSYFEALQYMSSYRKSLEGAAVESHCYGDDTPSRLLTLVQTGRLSECCRLAHCK